MKSVCTMVCQKNENVLQASCKPFFKPCPKPPANPVPNPLRPLRGLHSLHLNKSKRGEYNRGFALQTNLLNIQSRVFLVTLLSTPKRNMLRHSTNPCGKPSAFFPFPFLPPWGGLYANAPNQTLMGWIQISSAFPFPLEGDWGGEYNLSFRFAKGYLFPSLACSSVFPTKPE